MSAFEEAVLKMKEAAAGAVADAVEERARHLVEEPRAFEKARAFLTPLRTTEDSIIGRCNEIIAYEARVAGLRFSRPDRALAARELKRAAEIRLELAANGENNG